PEFNTKSVLMLSSTDRLTFKDRCQHSGADGLLEKPVSHSNLLDAIVTALGFATSEAEDVASSDGSKQPSPPHRVLDVLLVEDTPANRKVAERVLQKRGHRVVTAGNGRDAVDHVRQREFDVVLMDVQ